jgi:hypothetical protein
VSRALVSIVLVFVLFGAVGATPPHAQCLSPVPLRFGVRALAQERPPVDRVGPEDPHHQGQPRTCANREGIEAAVHDCACHSAKTCEKPAQESSTCQVYCRRDACRCRAKHCDTN